MVIHQRAQHARDEHRIHRYVLRFILEPIILTRYADQGTGFPSDHHIHRDWLAGVIDEADESKELHPVLKEFKDLIEGNTRIYLLVNSMFEQIPSKKPYARDVAGHGQVRDYQHMLILFNHLLATAPEWSDR
jgi:phosphatidylserine decarboxylase